MRTQVRLPAATYYAAVNEAGRSSRSMNAVIVAAVNDYLGVKSGAEN